MSGPTPTDACSPRDATEQEVDRIANDASLDERAMIDAIREVRSGPFEGDMAIINAYLASNHTLDDGDIDPALAEAAQKIAAPIEAAYSTGDHGVYLYDREQRARKERRRYSPEEALEIWGPERDFPEPSEQDRNKPCTETQLWSTWWTFLHAARRIPWTDKPQQDRLLGLFKALQARPDPPLPPGMDAPERGWVWSADGGLWSDMTLFGPACREEWNVCPGCNDGWSLPEQHSWINLNSFVARLTSNGVRKIPLYGVWAVRDALEKNEIDLVSSRHQPAPVAVQLSLLLTAAAVWVIEAGQCMFNWRDPEADKGDVNGEGMALERGGQVPWNQGVEPPTAARWTFWRRMFEKEAHNETLSGEVRGLCTRAFKMIALMEQGKKVEV